MAGSAAVAPRALTGPRGVALTELRRVRTVGCMPNVWAMVRCLLDGFLPFVVESAAADRAFCCAVQLSSTSMCVSPSCVVSKTNFAVYTPSSPRATSVSQSCCDLSAAGESTMGAELPAPAEWTIQRIVGGGGRHAERMRRDARSQLHRIDANWRQDGIIAKALSFIVVVYDRRRLGFLHLVVLDWRIQTAAAAAAGVVL
eukprot:2502043-Pleurochrysis_carterae.AAC.1